MDSKLLKHLVLGGLFLNIILPCDTVIAHGYIEKPKARQQFCVEDGGYWWPDDGSAIPNSACRQAFLESGTFQFVQNIEFAANVSDYLNIDAVKGVVKDGLLCAAGDEAKRGIDVPSPDWQKTVITPDQNGEFEVQFFGATPHNPSFWEFYLTKADFNPDTDIATWNSLELIDQKGDIPISQIDGKNMYQMKVKLPSERTGNAVLFTRWQRNDVAGEGFYNCSDITIKNDPSLPVDWFDKGYFVKQGQEASVGDEVWFRLFDATGNELVFEKLPIDESNSTQAVWAEQLATRINRLPSGEAVIGILDQNGVINYQSSNTLANKVWSRNEAYTFALDVKKSNQNQPPVVELAAAFQADAGEAISISANATDPEGDALTYQWSVPEPLQATGLDSAKIDIAGYVPAKTTDYSIRLLVTDGVNQVEASTTLTIRAATSGCNDTDPDASNYPQWVAGKSYQSNDSVSHIQLVWRANWWNENSEPSLANQAWSLTSNVELGWQSGVAYAKDDEVNHNSRRWKAKWWTNAEPGKSNDWQDVGPSTCTAQ